MSLPPDGAVALEKSEGQRSAEALLKLCFIVNRSTGKREGGIERGRERNQNGEKMEHLQ